MAWQLLTKPKEEAYNARMKEKKKLKIGVYNYRYLGFEAGCFYLNRIFS